VKIISIWYVDSVIAPEKTIVVKFPSRVKIWMFNIMEGKRIRGKGVADVFVKGFNVHNYRGLEYWDKK